MATNTLAASVEIPPEINKKDRTVSAAATKCMETYTEVTEHDLGVFVQIHSGLQAVDDDFNQTAGLFHQQPSELDALALPPEADLDTACCIYDPAETLW